MPLDDALRHYMAGQFSDGDVTRCTGLSVRSWRELIKRKAVRTTQERGRGRVRQCDQTTFKRTAVIAALHEAGFSLPMAGRLAYLLPSEDRIHGFCDPIGILFDHAGKVDSATGLPPRRKKPRVDWFDAEKLTKADPNNDCLIEIFDARFVGFSYFGHGPWIYGELRDNRTRFTSWYPFHQQNFVHEQSLISGKRFKEFFEASLPKWDYRTEPANKIDLDFLEYDYQNHRAKDDPLQIAAQAGMENPVLRTTVNVTLALRRALRRYLGIESEPLIREGDSR
jgi:hypothetical protein